MRRKVAYTTRRQAEPLPGGEPTSAGEETVAGPSTTGAAEAAIPHAGTGAKGGSAAGGASEHPQNLVAPTRAGHGQGTSGGAIERPQDKVKPSSAAKQPNPVHGKRESRATPKKEAAGSRKTTFGERKNLGHFLGKVARGTGRPA